MNDSDFIKKIARKWVELGGDSEGVVYSWKRLQEAVIKIEYAQQGFAPDAAGGVRLTVSEPPYPTVEETEE